jgi:hypothetical protein
LFSFVVPLGGDGDSRPEGLMRIRGTLLLSLLFSFAMTFASASAANDPPKKTTITFQQDMQVPGTTLGAGTYVFKVAGSQSGWDIVQIFNQDESALVTTVLAVPNADLQPSGGNVLTYPTGTNASIRALEASFYPGDNVAEEFVYPKSVADQLSSANHTVVPTTGTEESYPDSLKSSEAASQPDANDSNHASPANSNPPAAEPQPAASPVTEAAGAQAERTPSAENATAPANNSPSEPQTDTRPEVQGQSEQRPETGAATHGGRLPQTASSLPLVGLIGLLAVGGVLVLQRISRTLL